jgi:hypothetical protein
MSRRHERIDALIDAHVSLSRRRCKDDKTPMQQFKQGLATVHQALLTAINQRGIPIFHVAYTVEGAGLRPHDATFIVATNDNRTESLMFTREEISESAHRINSFADAKVRVLVSRCSFVG